MIFILNNVFSLSILLLILGNVRIQSDPTALGVLLLLMIGGWAFTFLCGLSAKEM